ncbi:hypothetical protein BDF21DRAFT_394266 [Thamnidium elegans]|nr:hypothetical protein BDF21DRAFT_394266 [Thamnidium elegans]
MTFNETGQKDLQTCYFVCKSWYSVAIPLNWESINLPNYKVALVKSHLNGFDHYQYFKYGHLITTLTIDGPEIIKGYMGHKFSKPELLMLLNQLPNLSNIDLNYSDYVTEYLEALLYADLQCINEINIGDNEHFNCLDLHFLTCYKSRNSISRMSLSYDKSTIVFNSQQINILNSLTQFNQLEWLHFKNSLDIDLTPYHVQNVCPELKHLIFFSNFPISERAILRLLGTNSEMNRNFSTSLISLELQLPSLSATYTRYLVDYFPSQLNKITIRIPCQGIFGWINTVGMGLALQLMEKIGKIKETFIFFEENSEVQVNDETDMTKYFRLLNAFRGSRQGHCTANFSEEGSTCSIFRYDLSGNLSITYDSRSDDFNSSNFRLNLPDKTSSIIGHEIFDTLNLSCKNLSHDIVRQNLNYFFLNCPTLQSFDFRSSLGVEFEYSYIRYKHKEDLLSSNLTNRDINFLEVGNLYPAQTFFDMMTTHLRDIEAVSLGALDWGHSHNDSTFAYTSQISLLKKNDNKNDDFVLLKYTNGEELYYYIDKEKNKNPQAEYIKNPTMPRLTIVSDTSVSFDFCESKPFYADPSYITLFQQ